MSTSNPDWGNLALKAALAHIANGGSITAQGPQANAEPGSAPPLAQGGPPGPPAGPAPAGGQPMMPPLPPPPPMNFTDFATRPENGMAIQGALSTKKNQPTPFNHPPAQPPVSIFNPSPNLYPLSSPATAPAPQQAAPQLVPAAGMPSLPAPSAPDVAPAMPTSVAGTQLAPTAAVPQDAPSQVNPGLMTQDEYFQAHPEMLAHPQASTPLGKALLFLTAGLSGAAGGLHGDPLAGLRYAQSVGDYNRSIPDLNQQRYEAGAVKPFQQALSNQETQAHIAQMGAETAKNQAQTTLLPQQAADRRQASRNKIVSDAAKRGQKVDFDEDGNPTFTDDPESEAFKQKDAAIKYAQSHQELAAAQAEYEKQKGNPNSPAFQIAAGRLAVARQNANTASAALGLHAQQFGFEQDKFYNPQPTATQRTKGDLANSSLERIKEMRQIVAKHPDIFGPSEGRATNAKAWLGSQDPDAQTYISAANYLAEHSAGTFGGRGKYIIEQLHGLTDPHSNPAALNAALDEAERAAQGFSDAGKLHGRPAGQSPWSGSSGGGGQAPEGTVATNAAGQKVVKRNGKWVAQ